MVPQSINARKGVVKKKKKMWMSVTKQKFPPMTSSSWGDDRVRAHELLGGRGNGNTRITVKNWYGLREGKGGQCVVEI